ncbi:hypothetical protein T484DRAFT_3162702 [Baffinella frigidus]|nr:hypothetical protein T484DRAFT_3162702 [Cryptophyta sp. CCMP2293]
MNLKAGPVSLDDVHTLLGEVHSPSLYILSIYYLYTVFVSYIYDTVWHAYTVYGYIMISPVMEVSIYGGFPAICVPTMDLKAGPVSLDNVHTLLGEVHSPSLYILSMYRIYGMRLVYIRYGISRVYVKDGPVSLDDVHTLLGEVYSLLSLSVYYLCTVYILSIYSMRLVYIRFVTRIP